MKGQDWIGNRKTVFATLGASNHSAFDREPNDFYATEPKATELLLEKEQFHKSIWEPACGQGHISEVLKRHGHTVYSTDLIDRGYGIGGQDFLMHGSLLDMDMCVFGGGVVRYNYKSPVPIRPRICGTGNLDAETWMQIGLILTAPIFRGAGKAKVIPDYAAKSGLCCQ